LAGLVVERIARRELDVAARRNRRDRIGRRALALLVRETAGTNPDRSAATAGRDLDAEPDLLSLLEESSVSCPGRMLMSPDALPETSPLAAAIEEPMTLRSPLATLRLISPLAGVSTEPILLVELSAVVLVWLP
jgi:hypothetical protein